MQEAYDVTKSLLGPLGGQLALAFGAGCAAGYAFCIRTVYRLLNAHSDTRHDDCMKLIEQLKGENEELKLRVTVLEDRLYHGNVRQMDQLRESGVRLIGEIKGDEADK